MEIDKTIRMALAYSGISLSELARRLGTSPSNLTQKLQKGTLTPNYLTRIGEAIGAEFHCGFRFPDGKEV